MFDSAAKTAEAEIIENGQTEIDGPSEADDYQSKQADIPCKGHRVVRAVRSNEQKDLWKNSTATQSRLRASIVRVLKHIYEDLEEIPYIATYRKQSCGELLSLAPDEVPDCTTLEDYKSL